MSKAGREVSIPIGFSQALQRRAKPRRGGNTSGFNPYRVFSGLATEAFLLVLDDRPLFQSLSGFLRPCNLFRILVSMKYRIVSIPIGFSQALQLPSLSPRPQAQPCFNPYRVFSGLATLGCRELRGRRHHVSIPIGFSQALQPTSRRSGPNEGARFQSLSGFLRPCNLISIEINSHLGSFNPYRVFSGLATLSPFGRL